MPKKNCTNSLLTLVLLAINQYFLFLITFNCYFPCCFIWYYVCVEVLHNSFDVLALV